MARGRRAAAPAPPPMNVTMTNAQLTALVAQAVAAATAAVGAQRNLLNRNNNGVTPVPRGSHKEFMDGKPLTFEGTEGPIGLIRWYEKAEAVFAVKNCVNQDRVKFAASTFLGDALSWWNTHVTTVGRDVANAMPWEEFKQMLVEQYCPRSEIREMEIEFWSLKVKGNDPNAFITRFRELSKMCPSMVTPEYKGVELFISGLPEEMQDVVTGAGKGTVSEVIELSQDLMKQRLRRGVKPKGVETQPVDHKRKWDGGHASHYPNKRQDVGKNFYGNQSSGASFSGNVRSGAVNPGNRNGTKGYAGCAPYCGKCEK